MKKFEIKKIFSIILMIILLLFTTKVNASNDSFNTTLTSSNTEIKRGSNVTITIGLKDISIESGEKGIGSYTAHIEVDPNVLEYVEANGTSKWKEPSYLNGNIAATTKDGKVINDVQDIASITFKVKEDAPLGKTTIELTNFSGSTAVTDIPTSNKTIELTILDKDNGNNNGDNNSGNNSGDNGDNNGGNNSDNNNNNQNGGSNNSNDKNDNINNNPNKEPGTPNKPNTNDTTINQKVLPKTGVNNTIIFIATGISAVFAAIFFIKFKFFNTIK